MTCSDWTQLREVYENTSEEHTLLAEPPNRLSRLWTKNLSRFCRQFLRSLNYLNPRSPSHLPQSFPQFILKSHTSHKYKYPPLSSLILNLLLSHFFQHNTLQQSSNFTQIPPLFPGVWLYHCGLPQPVVLLSKISLIHQTTLDSICSTRPWHMSDGLENTQWQHPPRREQQRGYHRRRHLDFMDTFFDRHRQYERFGQHSSAHISSEDDTSRIDSIIISLGTAER